MDDFLLPYTQVEDDLEPEACLPTWFRETRSVPEGSAAHPTDTERLVSTTTQRSNDTDGVSSNRTLTEEYEYYEEEAEKSEEVVKPKYNRGRGHKTSHHETTLEPHLVEEFLKIQSEMCHNYCLHGAACHIVAVGSAFQPVCDCPPNTQGIRCELVYNRRMYEPITGKVQQKRPKTDIVAASGPEAKSKGATIGLHQEQQVLTSSMLPILLIMTVFFIFGFGFVYYLKSARLQNMTFGSSMYSSQNTGSMCQTPDTRLSTRTHRSTTSSAANRTYSTTCNSTPARHANNSTVVAGGGPGAPIDSADRNQNATFMERLMKRTPGRCIRQPRSNIYGGLPQAESTPYSAVEHNHVHFTDKAPTIINIEENDSVIDASVRPHE